MNQLVAALQNVTPTSFKKNVDWAWVLVVALPFVLLGVSKDQAYETILFTIHNFAEILPFRPISMALQRCL